MRKIEISRFKLLKHIMLFKQYTFIYLFTYQKGLWVELSDVVAYHQLHKDKLVTLNMSEFGWMLNVV